jgi:hypothetical protein
LALTCLLSFPLTVPQPGAPFPPLGPSGRFPSFISTVERSDFLTPFPLCLVFLRRHGTCRCMSFRSRLGPCIGRCGPGVCSPGFAAPACLSTGDVRISQVPRGPFVHSPRPQTPVGRVSQALSVLSGRPGAAFRHRDGVSHHNNQYFEAPSRGSRTRCLRFVAGLPFPTQDSLPAWCPPFSWAGLSPAGSLPRVSSGHRLTSSPQAGHSTYCRPANRLGLVDSWRTPDIVRQSSIGLSGDRKLTTCSDFQSSGPYRQFSNSIQCKHPDTATGSGTAWRRLRGRCPQAGTGLSAHWRALQWIAGK